MSRDAVTLVQRLWAHFGETGEPDFAALRPDVEVHDHDIPDAGEYRGHAGFLRWMEDWAQGWESYAIVPESFVDAGGRVVALVRMEATGAGSGVTVRRNDAIVYELRDGLIARMDYYNDRAQALAAAGVEG